MPTDTLADASLRAQKLRLMIFDVDGILTDGGLRYGAEGELIKTPVRYCRQTRQRSRHQDAHARRA
jgi:hypothetical protein